MGAMVSNQNAWAKFRQIVRSSPRPWLLRADIAVSVACVLGALTCTVLAFFVTEQHARFWTYCGLSLVFFLTACMSFVHFAGVVQKQVYHRDPVFFTAFITMVLWAVVIAVAVTDAS